MLKLNLTTQFKRDLKLCKKRGYNINLLNAIVNTLRIPAALPPKNKDHSLKGNYTGRLCKVTFQTELLNHEIRCLVALSCLCNV
ncbi:MAG: type II toxin-antitoxin system YafQ family toxin [Lachnospiraceae bacterium]|nr:type II toxin-antitoxin system YafQ family toxin [Lachnospiraceae bacterium]